MHLCPDGCCSSRARTAVTPIDQCGALPAEISSDSSCSKLRCADLSRSGVHLYSGDMEQPQRIARQHRRIQKISACWQSTPLRDFGLTDGSTRPAGNGDAREWQKPPLLSRLPIGSNAWTGVLGLHCFTDSIGCMALWYGL